MARSRNIKPSFFQNEELGELSPLARLFFIGLWTEADFKGCVEFRPKRLKVRLLPYDDCDAEELAINLERSGFVSIYSVQGTDYIKIINFSKHQNPHKNEREAGGDIPDISSADEKHTQAIDSIALTNNRDKDGTNRDKDGTTPADSLLLIPSSLNPLTQQKPSREPNGFAEFWDSYPKKVGKGAAEASFKKLQCSSKLPILLSSLAEQKKSEQWQKENGQFIPNPATWLNQRRWEDTPAPAQPEKPKEASPVYSSMPWLSPAAI